MARAAALERILFYFSCQQKKQTPFPSLDPASNISLTPSLFPSSPPPSHLPPSFPPSLAPSPDAENPERIWVRCQANVLPANKSCPVHPGPRCSLLIPLWVWLNVTVSEPLALPRAHSPSAVHVSAGSPSTSRSSLLPRQTLGRVSLPSSSSCSFSLSQVVGDPNLDRQPPPPPPPHPSSAVSG